MLTYKTLYSLVDEQIEKRVKFNTTSAYDNQLSRTDTAPYVMTANGREGISSTELIEALQAVLDESLPNNIIEGLQVTADTPTSAYINISAGNGTAGGVMWTLEEDVIILVPFDADTEVFYVTLYKDMIRFDKKEETDRLKLAKIVVPNPGVTNKVKNRRDDDFPWDAYIVNFYKYNLYGINDKLEEDSIDLLRDNIGEILADNLIGNIKLSENLTITNTTGTLLLDSQSVQIKDSDGNIIAKFNKSGTFFYDNSGVELARFGAENARVGNILVTTNSIESADFSSGTKGFRIADSGIAEFEDVTVRGRISSSVFEYDKISSIGGKIYVGNSSALANDVSTTDLTITVDDSVFSVNDVITIKDGTTQEYMLVTSIASAPTYTVTRNLNNNLTVPSWNKGTAIVSTGNGGATKTGNILLDAVSTYAPFIDIALRNSTTYTDLTTKVRLGNLAGITDADYGVLSGYGLYATNVYLKGSLYAPDIKTAISGNRIELDTDNLIAYNNKDEVIFKVDLTGPSGSGISAAGDVVIGNFANNRGMKWDDSRGKFYVRGDIMATSGVFTGTVTVGTANNVYIDGDKEVIKVYDESGNLRVELGKLS